MIRQAISCDICGAEKKQTNHWFVAYTHGGELRVTGWGTQGKLRAGAKHLCGQTCLHKLLDEFIAAGSTGKAQAPMAEPVAVNGPVAPTDTSLTCAVAYQKPISSPAGLPVPAMPASVIAIAPSRPVDDIRALSAAPLIDDVPNYSSRHWRAEAWERERERERRSSVAGRRKSL
jgi:hypothetical protein